MVILFALLLLWVPEPAIQFSNADARILVRNAPGVGELAEKCVLLNESRLPNDKNVVLFMVYSKCGKPAASNLVGPYYVDLRTGAVRVGDPDNEPEQSQRLKQVRESLLRKKAAAKTSGKARTK